MSSPTPVANVRSLAVAFSLLALAASCAGAGDEGGLTGEDLVGGADTRAGTDTAAPPECQTSQDCADKGGALGPCEVAVCVAGESTCAVEAVSDGTGCDDGDLCTDGDQCVAGECAPGEAPVCDDGNPCTEDSCDPLVGCVVSENTCPCAVDADCADFEDEDLCNGTLHCVAGEDSLTTCEVDPATVVVCEDADACTGPATCEAGLCSPGEALDCDDENPCTDDACDPVGGCTHVDNGSCGDCIGIECLGCAFGVDCAAQGPFIDDTCCAVG